MAAPGSGWSQGILDAAIFAALAGVIWFALWARGVALASDSTFIGLLTGAVILAAYSMRRGVRRYVQWRERVWTQAALAANAETLASAEQLGIDRVYDTLKSASVDIVRDLEHAKDIRLFVQLGRYMVGGPHSLLYDALAKRNPDDVYVRILHASKDSPFLSPDRLRKRQSNIREIQAGIQHIRDQVLALRDDGGIKLEPREHKEPYLWRLLFFDEVAYVSGYFFEKDNDEKAVVYRLVNGDKSLYRIFDRYFEYLWEAYPPRSGTLHELIPSSAESGAAILARREDRFVLMVFDRSQEVDGRFVYRFAGLGGKRLPNESWLDCAMREGREETGGCAITLISAAESRYLDLSKRLLPIEIDADPRPLSVIETPDEGMGRRAGWGKRYTTVYFATIEGELRVQSEIRGFLLVTAELLLKMYRQPVTFKEFHDFGGRYSGDKPPNDAILKPYGAAELLAICLESHPGLLAPLKG